MHEDPIVDGRSTGEGGRRAALQLLRRKNPPAGVLCGNNNMTLGFMEALKVEGVRALGDIAFVSFDDLEWSELMELGVTAVSQPFHAIGSRAVKMALDRIADPGRPPRTLRLDCYIEHRSSCGCP